MLRRFLKDYLGFNRKDRIGAMILMAIMSIIIFLPVVSSKPEPFVIETAPPPAVSAEQNHSQERKPEDFAPDPFQPTVGNTYRTELFTFDPNLATEDEWRRLGLSAKTTKTILNYRNKGGKFYKPEDLKKIWGLQPAFFERVKNYIQIAETPKTTFQNSYQPYQRQERPAAVIDINTADSTDLMALPGIGSRLSARIINFREKLGGFYSVDQLAETYGVPDSTFQNIRSRLSVNADAVRKININTATKDELRLHPYVKWNLANAIVEYRNQHGSYNAVSDLSKIVLIDPPTLEKLKPYLTVE